MHDDQHFLADIRESPGDDGPRLVYADWLEEQGDSTRAELIRVQCELAAMPWDAKGRAKLQNRELALFRKHKPEWLGEYASMVRVAHFERGFVERVALSPQKFLQHSDAIFARAPIQKVTLLQVSDKTAPAIAACESLRHVRDFDISGHLLTSAGWHQLFASPHLTGLSAIELSMDSERVSTVDLLDALLDCRSLPGIERFSAHLELADGASQQAFQELPIVNLKSLALPSLSTDGFRLIGAMPYFPKLNRLNLSNQHVARDSFQQLSANASNLRQLNISRSTLTNRHARSLAQCGRFDNLEELDVHRNVMTNKGLVHLLIGLPSLTRLDISGNPIGGKDLGPLRQAAKPLPLEELTLDHYGISEVSAAAIEVLAECLRPKKLAIIGSCLSDDAIAPLLESPNMSRLRHLDLSNNRLKDATVERIARSPHLSELRFLSLKDNLHISGNAKKRLRDRYGVGVCTFSR